VGVGVGGTGVGVAGTAVGVAVGVVWEAADPGALQAATTINTIKRTIIFAPVRRNVSIKPVRSCLLVRIKVFLRHFS
jgi:hypothetical protein